MKKTTTLMPIITADELHADVLVIEAYLETLIAADDAVSQTAFDLRHGKEIDGKAPIDFRAMMEIARRYAYQLDDTSAADYQAIEERLYSAVYGHLVREPSVFDALFETDRMTPVVTVALTAIGRAAIMETPGEIMTSFRYARCLSRMNEQDCHDALAEHGLDAFPYSWSRRELDEVEQEEYTFFAGQLVSGDVREWVMAMPGYIPERNAGLLAKTPGETDLPAQ